MATARETALAALAAHLAAAFPTGPEVLRNADLPGTIPPEGVLVLMDGNTIEEEPIFSPLSYNVTHEAELICLARGSTMAAATTALDTLLGNVAAAMRADRRLGGVVDWAECGAPSFDMADAQETSTPTRAATVRVALLFNSGTQALA